MNLLAFLTSIAIAFVLFVENVGAAPYQELEPRKGYVPVYIRYGDTPLSAIHPKLAEAFHEADQIQTQKNKSTEVEPKELKIESTDTENAAA